MSDPHHEVRLSAEEVEYLKEISGSNPKLSNLLVPQFQSDGVPKTVIRVDANSAERLRDLLTERLAQVGFDAEYNLNSKGRMLEMLIDRLYLPHSSQKKA